MNDVVDARTMDILRQAVTMNQNFGKFAKEGGDVSASEELAFQNVFLRTPDGPYVLKRILERTGAFEASIDPLEMIQRNVGLEIAACCGLDSGSIIDAILNRRSE